MDSEPPTSFDSARLFAAALSPSSAVPSSPLPPIPSDIPRSKIIPNTRFLVDAFRHAGDHSSAYFLSHFHSDHYAGLSPNWRKGIIFCSLVTSRLLSRVLGIPDCFLAPLPIGETVSVDGCDVTLVDANHCPGAVQFLFKVPVDGDSFERFVHTGDFRFCDSMTIEPLLKQFVGCNAVFLDNTYCDPKFLFPSQEESIDYIVSVVERIESECRRSLERVLFLVATYVIGKEKILLEVGRRCSCKVYVNSRKMSVLSILGHEGSDLFTEDENESDVHVVGWNVLGETWPYFRPNFVNMEKIKVEKEYDKVVGFVPTGWTYEVKRSKFAVRTKDSLEIHLVPYSEHSNYDELREFVKFLKPKRVIPTVGVDVEKIDCKHLQKLQKHFAGLVDETANKKDFFINFHRVSSEQDEMREGEGLQNAGDISENCCSVSVIDGSSTQEEPAPISPLTSDAAEEVLLELRAFLPSWATRDQMLDLISTSGADIIAAVSNFYEHETYFYRQVSASLTAPSDVSEPVLIPTCVMNNPAGNMEFLSNKEEKLNKEEKVTKTVLVNGTACSGTKRSVNNKKNPKRRRKANVQVEPVSGGSGPRQSTITSFFTKK